MMSAEAACFVIWISFFQSETLLSKTPDSVNCHCGNDLWRGWE